VIGVTKNVGARRGRDLSPLPLLPLCLSDREEAAHEEKETTFWGRGDGAVSFPFPPFFFS